MAQIRVTPGSGRRVRDKLTTAVVPEEGAVYEMSSYWSRKERDGDVTLETISEQAPNAPKTAARSSAKREE